MIAINWGTSNFRAYKLDSAGNVEAERSSGCGAVQVPQGGFLDALMAEVGDWIRDGETKVLMSGMVGARNGWKEAPYVAVPATFGQVVAGVIRLEVKSLDARIVPGLIGADDGGVPEVMRGEETEIFGLKSEGRESELPRDTQLCLPGTHAKWVRIKSGKIAAFSTSMTGDLYKAIREGTILRTCTQQEPTDGDAFLRGVARSKQEGELAHHLFGVRTLVLTGKMQESSASSYLSGLLIGHEVKARAQAGERVHLIGDSTLCSLYATALHEFDVSSSVEPAGAALRGLVRIAGSLAW
jgi:2-dehydro-3-deoxygalactonokinase